MSGTELGATELKFGTGKIRLFWDAVNERLDVLDHLDNVLIRIDPATVTSFPGGVAAFDLDAPGAIGGTTPAAGTFTTLTANTSLAVNRPAEGLSELSLTTSSQSGGIQMNGGTLVGLVATVAPWYATTTNFYIGRSARPPTGNTTIDIGIDSQRFRNLWLSGDATIGGSTYGATGGNVLIQSDGDITFRIDADNNGANTFMVKNGEGTNVLTVDEAGALATVDVAASGDITVGDDLTVAGRVSTTTVTTFTADDATPSVAAGNIFITATTGSAVPVTAIDDPVEGQPVLIIPTASPVTTIPHALIENRSADWLSSGGEPLNLIYANSQWWEK